MRRGRLRHIDPVTELREYLLEVEKPARYLGGEAGSIRKADDELLTFALCFPDLYEIGMSNNAIRLIYSGLNSKPNVRAERVFSPAPDFEALLKRIELPLYTLETGIPLEETDLIGISLGYELAATSIVAVLESGRVPIRADERSEDDPIVIVGGPAATNPHPFGLFLDAAYIGEAEAGFYEAVEEMALMKRAGALRSDLLERLSKLDAVWIPARRTRPAKRAKRAIFTSFPSTAAIAAFPLPTVKTVQDHGTVEIMRGCPNGCRFCHAGYYYRPQRIKPYEIIEAEVEALVTQGGYREITLASLSSGDYPDIGILLDKLNTVWGVRQVSFQLPSLKISSFTLPIVRKLAEVRKSGLTFAVETPVDEWQKSINKDVSFEKTIAILEEARASGFKQAKFYFMLGLPVPDRGIGEARAIVEFFQRLRARIDLQINVNVGTFVPKPHTPYQWAGQLCEDEALEAINLIRSELKKCRNIKISYHSPFISKLEGVIARGDERVGELILEAYRRGARLDAWEEHFNRELWRSVLEKAEWPVLEEGRQTKNVNDSLVWDDIDIRVTKRVFIRELERSIVGELTSGCAEKCTEPCGVCGPENRVQSSGDRLMQTSSMEPELESIPIHRPKNIGRIVFQFEKRGAAAYLQHLSLIDAFTRAFQISGLGIAYSEGFNPMPRLETAQPLPIAIQSDCEIASVLLFEAVGTDAFITSINRSLPVGLRVTFAEYHELVDGKKQRTIGSLEWGSEYNIGLKDIRSRTALNDSLSVQIAQRGIAGASIIPRPDSGTVSLRLPLPRNKNNGLIRILEACTEIRPIQVAFEITRHELFADVGDGIPQSFFTAYSLV